MKKYMNGKSEDYYAKTMAQEVRPYHFCYAPIGSRGYLFEGYPNKAEWETVGELINLVEMISEHCDIPINNSHIVTAGDGDDFITFTVPKYEE